MDPDRFVGHQEHFGLALSCWARAVSGRRRGDTHWMQRVRE